jgi:RNA polymerase sigma factor (sigma-70 family)
VASADCSPPDLAALLPNTVHGGLLIVAVRSLGDVEEAQDAVQETLVRTLAAIRGDRVPPGVPLEAFVYGIARHVITDVQRRRMRERGATGDPEALPAPGPSAREALVHADEREAAALALATLPAADRELLKCCFVQGERVAAIAARLGEPADRLRKRKSRALERLREALGRSRAGHEAASRPTVAT